MKILLLIISLMFYIAAPPSKKTYYINKDSAVKVLNDSIPLFQTISNEMMGKITNQFNNALHFNINDFKEMKNPIFLTGEISEEYLSVNFRIHNLDQLNNFNQSIASSLELGNIKFKFTSIVISLIKNIFQSSTFPKEDIEISSNEESNFLTSIRDLLKKNKNTITISVTHKYGTEVTFHCYLNKNAHNVVKNSESNESQEHEGAAFRCDSQEATHNPNESQEHEGAALLDKKRQ